MKISTSQSLVLPKVDLSECKGCQLRLLLKVSLAEAINPKDLNTASSRAAIWATLLKIRATLTTTQVAIASSRILNSLVIVASKVDIEARIHMVEEIEVAGIDLPTETRACSQTTKVRTSKDKETMVSRISTRDLRATTIEEGINRTIVEDIEVEISLAEEDRTTEADKVSEVATTIKAATTSKEAMAEATCTIRASEINPSKAIQVTKETTIEEAAAAASAEEEIDRITTDIN